MVVCEFCILTVDSHPHESLFSTPGVRGSSSTGISTLVLFSAAVAVGRFFKGGKLFLKHEWISFSLLAEISLDKFREKAQ